MATAPPPNRTYQAVIWLGLPGAHFDEAVVLKCLEAQQSNVDFVRRGTTRLPMCSEDGVVRNVLMVEPLWWLAKAANVTLRYRAVYTQAFDGVGGSLLETSMQVRRTIRGFTIKAMLRNGSADIGLPVVGMGARVSGLYGWSYPLGGTHIGFLFSTRQGYVELHTSKFD